MTIHTPEFGISAITADSIRQSSKWRSCVGESRSLSTSEILDNFSVDGVERNHRAIPTRRPGNRPLPVCTFPGWGAATMTTTAMTTTGSVSFLSRGFLVLLPLSFLWIGHHIVMEVGTNVDNDDHNSNANEIGKALFLSKQHCRKTIARAAARSGE